MTEDDGYGRETVGSEEMYASIRRAYFILAIGLMAFIGLSIGLIVPEVAG